MRFSHEISMKRENDWMEKRCLFRDGIVDEKARLAMNGT